MNDLEVVFSVSSCNKININEQTLAKPQEEKNLGLIIFEHALQCTVY